MSEVKEAIPSGGIQTLIRISRSPETMEMMLSPIKRDWFGMQFGWLPRPKIRDRIRSEVSMMDDEFEGRSVDVTDSDHAAARRYSYEVWWSDEDNGWLGRVEELPGVMNHGESPEAALAATADSAALALAARREWKLPIPPPLEDRQPVTVRDLSFERPPVPTARDVRAIRERLGYSQAVFASALGVDLGTVRNWEQGKRQVAGAARRLLQAIDTQPRLLSFWIASNKNGQS